jgi:hypothetical protein
MPTIPICSGLRASMVTAQPGGVEYGTYSYDGSTTISGTVNVDENGGCGLAEGRGAFSVPAIVAGDTMTIDGSAIFHRL